MALKQRKNRSAAVPESCAVGECMALLGGAWTPNVVWHLSARLKDLEAKGVVARRKRLTSPPSVDYELTELGRELVPAIEAIVAVGQKLKAQARGTLRAAAA
jgi:DNA-binding HxlR family transcriptional regulator